MRLSLRRRALTAAVLSGLVVSSTAIADAPVPLIDVPVTDLTEDESATDVAPIAEPPAALVTSQPTTGTDCRCCNSTCCCAAKKKAAATEKMNTAYKGVFYANDFSYLDDCCYDGPTFLGDCLKGMCDGTVDVGGELRVRYHNERNHRGLGITGRDDNFWLTRYRMYSSYRCNDIFRLYGEYLYADSGGETFDNLSIEENRGEIQNLFIDTNLTESTLLRLGRQELLLGAQRLVSPLDWANTRRTFDGGRLSYHGDKWDLDGFFVHPVNRTPANESKIDDTDEDVDFFGGYASRKGLGNRTFEAYYFGLDDSANDFSYHTMGTRVAGKTDGGVLYETEGGFQFGDNSPGFGSHSAEYFTGGLGRQLNFGDCYGGDWKPTVWLWYDYASGGDDFPGARGDDGFDHLFPLAHKYLGFMDLFGRRNIHDINAQFITPVLGNEKVQLLLWYHYFQLDEATTPYGVTMQPYNNVAPAGDKELGHEIDVLLSVALNPRNSVLFGYSHFAGGDYYDTTALPAGVDAADVDADFFYFQFQTQF